MGNAMSGRFRKLSPGERKRIIGLVADGVSTRDVAREVSRSWSMVKLVMKEAGGIARRLGLGSVAGAVVGC